MLSDLVPIVISGSIEVLNKIDLRGADPGCVAKEIEEVVGLDCSNAIHCSAKEGIGITEILNAIIQRIPAPGDSTKRPLRALIFDSYYDPYRGVVAYFRVIDETLKKGGKIYFMASGKDYFADEIGVLSPSQMQVNELYAGEVGYLSASIRAVADARVGDTITHYVRKAEVPLSRYQESTPMVFYGLFPVDADQFPELRDALEKLQLNDAALKFEPESSSAMGFGFRCGFLGLLHMEIIQERLDREYNFSLITTAPSVVYQVNCVDGETVECSNPSLLPEPGKKKSIKEPNVKVENESLGVKARTIQPHIYIDMITGRLGISGSEFMQLLPIKEELVGNHYAEAKFHQVVELLRHQERDFA